MNDAAMMGSSRRGAAGGAVPRRVAAVGCTVALLVALGACSRAESATTHSPPGRRATPSRNVGEAARAARGVPATPSPSPTRAKGSSTPALPLLRVSRAGAGHLAPGSDPSVLPGPVLIADRDNNRVLVVDPQGRVRWQFPRKGDLAPGQKFPVPDDAFFSPDGRQIIVTEEDSQVVTVVDVARHRIVWRHGRLNKPGGGTSRLHHPDDAMMLRSGNVVVADIMNCRVLEMFPRSSGVLWHAGLPGTCVHNPPRQYGSPNGMFPLGNGHFLITEINGDWVDEIDQHGHVFWSTHPPGVTYPSDTNRYGPNAYLTVDYSDPGQVLLFDKSGKVLWRFRHGGARGLSKPSLALPLPNGDIILNDDANDRVIVVDPKKNRIVWQYGHKGAPGSGPGHLNNPDGLDLLPPHSYADSLH